MGYNQTRIFNQLAGLARFAFEQKTPASRSRSAAEIVGDVLAGMGKHPLHEVDTPLAAAAYAARAIGETLGATIGFKEMADLRDRLEDEVGPEEAEWISRCWVGTDCGGMIWSD